MAKKPVEKKQFKQTARKNQPLPQPKPWLATQARQAPQNFPQNFQNTLNRENAAEQKYNPAKTSFHTNSAFRTNFAPSTPAQARVLPSQFPRQARSRPQAQTRQQPSQTQPGRAINQFPKTQFNPSNSSNTSDPTNLQAIPQVKTQQDVHSFMQLLDHYFETGALSEESYFEVKGEALKKLAAIKKHESVMQAQQPQASQNFQGMQNQSLQTQSLQQQNFQSNSQEENGHQAQAPQKKKLYAAAEKALDAAIHAAGSKLLGLKHTLEKNAPHEFEQDENPQNSSQQQAMQQSSLQAASAQKDAFDGASISDLRKAKNDSQAMLDFLQESFEEGAISAENYRATKAKHAREINKINNYLKMAQLEDAGDEVEDDENMDSTQIAAEEEITDEGELNVFNKKTKTSNQKNWARQNQRQPSQGGQAEQFTQKSVGEQGGEEEAEDEYPDIEQQAAEIFARPDSQKQGQSGQGRGLQERGQNTEEPKKSFSDMLGSFADKALGRKQKQYEQQAELELEQGGLDQESESDFGGEGDEHNQGFGNNNEENDGSEEEGEGEGEYEREEIQPPARSMRQPSRSRGNNRFAMQGDFDGQEELNNEADELESELNSQMSAEQELLSALGLKKNKHALQEAAEDAGQDLSAPQEDQEEQSKTFKQPASKLASASKQNTSSPSNASSGMQSKNWRSMRGFNSKAKSGGDSDQAGTFTPESIAQEEKKEAEKEAKQNSDSNSFFAKIKAIIPGSHPSNAGGASANPYANAEVMPIPENSQNPSPSQAGGQASGSGAGEGGDAGVSGGSAMKILMELEKLKAKTETLAEMRSGLDERLGHIQESVGELRSMAFQRDSAQKELESKVEKYLDLVETLDPKKYMKEFDKRDKEMSDMQMHLEKTEAMAQDLSRTTADIRSLLQSIGNLKNISKVNSEIGEKLSKMDAAANRAERTADEVDRAFVEMSHKLEEFSMYAGKQEVLSETVRDLTSMVDAMNQKFESYTDKEQFATYAKQIENIKLKISEVEATKLEEQEGMELSPRAEELKEEKESVETLIENIEEEFDERKITSQEYENLKRANLHALSKIEAQMQNEYEDVLSRHKAEMKKARELARNVCIDPAVVQAAQTLQEAPKQVSPLETAVKQITQALTPQPQTQMPQQRQEQAQAQNNSQETQIQKSGEEPSQESQAPKKTWRQKRTQLQQQGQQEQANPQQNPPTQNPQTTPFKTQQPESKTPQKQALKPAQEIIQPPITQPQKTQKNTAKKTLKQTPPATAKIQTTKTLQKTEPAKNQISPQAKQEITQGTQKEEAKTQDTKQETKQGAKQEASETEKTQEEEKPKIFDLKKLLEMRLQAATHANQEQERASKEAKSELEQQKKQLQQEEKFSVFDGLPDEEKSLTPNRMQAQNNSGANATQQNPAQAKSKNSSDEKTARITDAFKNAKTQLAPKALSITQSKTSLPNTSKHSRIHKTSPRRRPI